LNQGGMILHSHTW